MMRIATTLRPSRSAPASAVAVACAGAVALAVFVSACAEKGLTPPQKRFSAKVSLQVTITADQQAGFGPRFLVAAAGFDGEDGDDGGFLGHAVIPFTVGTHQMTVPVDLSPCLAARSLKGKDGCPLLVGALISADTGFLSDTSSGDPFREAFDYHLSGPYMVGPGSVLPTISPIDLSVSRLGVVKWAGDNALQLGGDATPYGFSGPITGVPGTGAAAPTLMAVTQGHLFPASRGQPSQGPYPQLAIFQDGNWRRVTASVLPVGTAPFTDVAAVSASEAYIAHRTGLYRFDGNAIAKVAAVTDSIASVASVTSGASAKYVIAGGWNGVVWVGNTQTWTRYVLPAGQTINGGVCITGPAEAFAASTTGGGLFRFDGTTWTSVPATSAAGKYSLQCTASGQAFVMAQDGQRFSWNGSTWVVIPNTGLGFGRSVTWGVVSPTEIYAASDSANVDRAFYRFNGTSWQEIGRLRYTSFVFEPWIDPRGAAYFASAGFGRVEKVSGTSVSVVSYQPTLRDVIMTSLSSAFVVGSNALLARWDGFAWTVDAPPKGLVTIRNYRGVWSDGPKNAWAVGDGSSVIRYDGTGWFVVGSLTGTAGGVADSYNGVWGTGSDVWAVGDASLLHCKASGSCVNEPTGGTGALHSVWGVSSTNVFAVGAGGRIVRFNGTAWAAMTSPTNRTLRRVSGSGANNVWAVGDSTVLRFDGTQWTVAPDSGELRQLLNRFGTRAPDFPNHVGLWVRGPTEVYFTTDNGYLGRYNGRRWDSVGPEGFLHTMTGLSGLPGGCALAITEGQTDPHTQTLWRGINSGGCFLTPMVPPTKWP
jgi:hypothetical protein